MFEKNRQLAHFHEELLSYQCVCRPLTWRSFFSGQLNTQKDGNAKSNIFFLWVWCAIFFCDQNILNIVCVAQYIFFGSNIFNILYVAQYLFLWLKYFQYCVCLFLAEIFSISCVLCNIYLFYGWNIFNNVCVMLYIFWWQKYFQYLFFGWYIFNIVCVAQRTSCWQLSLWAYSCQLPDSLIRISSTNTNKLN